MEKLLEFNNKDLVHNELLDASNQKLMSNMLHSNIELVENRHEKILNLNK
jgi:hypothetical protein